MDNLENIILDGKSVNLETLSVNELKEILERITVEEKTIKQEIDSILRKLA